MKRGLCGRCSTSSPVRWYGNVVLVKSTAESNIPATEYVQSDPKDVYAFIEEDLKYASEVLPWAVDDTKRSSNAYRFSKGAALGLLAKVYCTWAGYPVRDESKWAEAAKVARQVVESGKHRLNPDYETVWSNTCNGIWDAGESLIEVSFYSPTSLDSDQTAGRIGKWNGVVADAVEGQRGRNAGNWKVVYTFTREWETHDDPRMALSIADYKYDSSKGDGPVTYFSTVSSPSEDNYNKQRRSSRRRSGIRRSTSIRRTTWSTTTNRVSTGISCVIRTCCCCLPRR